MSYLGPSLLGVVSRLPGEFLSSNMAAIEGHVETDTFFPPRAALAVGDKFVAVLRGVNMVTGLSLTPHPEDFVIGLDEVELVKVGGMREAMLSELPRSAGLKFTAGPARVEVRTTGGRKVRFKPAAYDQNFWDLLSVLHSSLVARAQKRLSPTPQDEYDIGEESAVATIRGALRYFPQTTSRTVELLCVLECVLVRNGNAWAGYAVISDDDLGFFEYADCAVEKPEAGSPVLLRMQDVTACSVTTPDSFTVALRRNVAVRRAAEPHMTINIHLAEQTMRLAVPLEELSVEDKPDMEVLVGNFLNLIDARLA